MASEAEILAGLTPDTRNAVKRLLTRARAQGLPAKLLEGRRTCARQATLYAQGRTTDGAVVTWAPGCSSWHLWGRAVDMHIGSDRCADYAELGAYWEKLGGGWGGRFPTPDCYHFELPHPDYKIGELCPDPSACDSAVSKEPAPSVPLVPFVLGVAAGAVLGRWFLR